MMVHRPEGQTLTQWLTKDLTFKTIIVTVVAICAFVYRHTGQINVVASTTTQRFAEEDRRDDELQKRLDAQRDSLKAKVDKETYEDDRARLSEQLQSIQLSLNTIQSVLMEHRAAYAPDPLAPGDRRPADVLAACGRGRWDAGTDARFESRLPLGAYQLELRGSEPPQDPQLPVSAVVSTGAAAVDRRRPASGA